MVMEKPEIIKLENILNQEAGLVVAQNDNKLPFNIQRVYWFYQVPSGQTRGHHAHKTNRKILICHHGEVAVMLEATTGELFKFTLDKPYEGLYVPPLHWGTYTFSQGASMICLASALYDEKDYIRNYEEFKGGYGA